MFQTWDVLQKGMHGDRGNMEEGDLTCGTLEEMALKLRHEG